MTLLGMENPPVPLSTRPASTRQMRVNNRSLEEPTRIEDVDEGNNQ
jgi:hypothetical protein